MGNKPIRATEVFILIFLIVVNFLDFFEYLPGDVDFMKKILSWLLLGYLLYRISLTKLFFGVRNKLIDISLIISYFLLITKSLVGYAYVSAEEANLLAPLYTFIISNNVAVELTSFYAGGIALIALSALITFLIKVKKPSIMSVIHEKGYASTAAKRVERFIATFFVLVFFFIVLFNLMMEWLAIAVDASLLIVAFIFYMLTLFRVHFKKLSPKSLIYKIGDVGEGFYEKFIGLFHSKESFFLGISGLLVLHLLTDVAIFIIPYILGFHDTLYFSQLGAGHEPLYLLFLKDTAASSTLLQKAYISWIYLFNIFGMLFLLILPAYIWYRLYCGKGFFADSKKLSMFFASVLVFIIAPVFKLKDIKVESLIGVDITTSQLNASTNLALVVFLSLLFGLVVYFLSSSHWIKEKLIAMGIAVVDLFFVLYIFYFFRSTASYYVETIRFLLFSLKRYLVAFYFIIFLIVISLFYIVGFLVFLSETRKEFRYIK
ncbi:hypothetical protein KY366_01895 [Candidatus Woesearchaeota archaeon]|nr:hypothetical protein [Candidatus Woesearchaeota archaeon]